MVGASEVNLAEIPIANLLFRSLVERLCTCHSANFKAILNKCFFIHGRNTFPARKV